MAVPTDERRLWTLNETAEYLSKQPQTLYKMIEEGRAPRSYKVGGTRRFKKADVDAWLETLASTGDGGQPDGQ
jgi:excisionase family DNA binding protein